MKPLRARVHGGLLQFINVAAEIAEVSLRCFHFVQRTIIKLCELRNLVAFSCL